MKQDYSPEQVKDIQEREAKGLEALKALELTPAAIISKQNLGNDVFGDRVQAYLQDTKYADKISPIQKDDIDSASTEPVEAQ